MSAKRKHRATGRKRGGNGNAPGRGGRPAQYRISPEVEEFRRHWRQRLTDPEWLAHIEKLARKSVPLLVELLRQGFGAPPAKVEHTGDPNRPVVYRAVLNDGNAGPAGGMPSIPDTHVAVGGTD